MLADEQTRAEVTGLLDAWSAAFEAKDVDAMMALCLPDDDLLLIGTGADELRRGPAAARAGFERDLGQADRVSIANSDVVVSAAGAAAWLYSNCEARAEIGGETIVMQGRNTMTLEQRDGRWLIAQWRLSLPAAEQEQGQSYAAPSP